MKLRQEKGDCGAALDQVHKAIAHDKTKGEAWVLFADCTAERGDAPGARSGYERALSTPDLSPEVREYAESRVAALASPAPGPVMAATMPVVKEEEATARRKGVPVAIVAGVGGGVVAVVAVVIVIVLVGRSGSLDFPDTTLGVMDWSVR